MRLVLFTANPRLEESAWWPVVLATPGLSAVLIVRLVQSRDAAAILRRLRRNVRKHGFIFVPYRVAVLAGAVAGAVASRISRRPHTSSVAAVPPVPVTVIEALDIHAPDVIERLSQWNADLGLSIGAPVLKPALFSVPTRGTLNVHLGRVPEFRGAPPGFWELWHDATEVGATIHWMDEGLDTGAVVEHAAAPIYAHDAPARVEARAMELGLTLLPAALARVMSGNAAGTRQPAGGTTNRAPTLRQRFALWRRLLRRRLGRRFADPLHPVKVVAASAWLTVWCPIHDFMRTLRGSHPVRVFTFHRVTDLCRDGMTVAPATFREQVEYIRRHHAVVGLDDALAVLSQRARLRRPVAVITFDDGYLSVARAARPVLDAAGVTATCFICTGLADPEARLAHDDDSPVRDWLPTMDWPELQELRSAGWHIGGHTVHHARLSAITGSELAREIEQPLAALRTLTSGAPVAMAYPFGGTTDITPEGVAIARAGGFRALFSNYGGENRPGADLFSLRRIDLGGDHDPLMWKAMARGLDLPSWGRRLRGHRAA